MLFAHEGLAEYFRIAVLGQISTASTLSFIHPWPYKNVLQPPMTQLELNFEPLRARDRAKGGHNSI
jgi:hypothetical protein